MKKLWEDANEGGRRTRDASLLFSITMRCSKKNFFTTINVRKETINKYLMFFIPSINMHQYQYPQNARHHYMLRYTYPYLQSERGFSYTCRGGVISFLIR